MPRNRGPRTGSCVAHLRDERDFESIAASFEARFLVGLNQNNVDFANVYARLHFVEVGYRHDLGARHRSRPHHSLSQSRIQLADRAGQRRDV